MNIYTQMAYYVAKTLHLRPNSVLDDWTAPELIVAYGEYANEETQKHYQEWKQLDSKMRSSVPQPPKYIVYFHGEKEWQQNESV